MPIVAKKLIWKTTVKIPKSPKITYIHRPEKHQATKLPSLKFLNLYYFLSKNCFFASVSMALESKELIPKVKNSGNYREIRDFDNFRKQIVFFARFRKNSQKCVNFPTNIQFSDDLINESKINIEKNARKLLKT